MNDSTEQIDEDIIKDISSGWRTREDIGYLLHAVDVTDGMGRVQVMLPPEESDQVALTAIPLVGIWVGNVGQVNAMELCGTLIVERPLSH